MINNKPSVFGDSTYQTLLREKNRMKLGYETREKPYEDFVDLVSSVGAELG